MPGDRCPPSTSRSRARWRRVSMALLRSGRQPPIHLTAAQRASIDDQSPGCTRTATRAVKPFQASLSTRVDRLILIMEQPGIDFSVFLTDTARVFDIHGLKVMRLMQVSWIG